MLAIASTTDFNITEDDGHPIILGQRFLATSPFFVFIDRDQ
jgi:hypothetical protein